MTENILTSSPFSIEERKKIFDQNYSDIKRRVEAAALKSGRTFKDINILAATKTIDVQVINYAINSGIMLIGENRVQEFLSKEDSLETNAERHFIGHLQSNKAKDIVGKVSLIHSVHSVKLAKVISDISLKKGIVTEILLEVNIVNEDSKSGFSKYEVVNDVT